MTSCNLENVTCKKCYLDGLRLIVHNHSIDPGYYSGGTKSGFILAPGFNHEIAIKRTFSSKLGLESCQVNIPSLHVIIFGKSIPRFLSIIIDLSIRSPSGNLILSIEKVIFIFIFIVSIFQSII